MIMLSSFEDFQFKVTTMYMYTGQSQGNPGNQSNYKANTCTCTCSRRKVKECVCNQVMSGFHFTSNWIRKWRELAC